MTSASSPWRAASHLFSRSTQSRVDGSGAPCSKRSCMTDTRHWASAATASTSSIVWMASHIRSSTVPKSGWGRTSHHTSRMEVMAPAVSSVPMKAWKSTQSSSWGGRPAVGRPSNTLVRTEASAVSWPCQ